MQAIQPKNVNNAIIVNFAWEIKTMTVFNYNLLPNK